VHLTSGVIQAQASDGVHKDVVAAAGF
jgi:hypothetical protein